MAIISIDQSQATTKALVAPLRTAPATTTFTISDGTILVDSSAGDVWVYVSQLPKGHIGNVMKISSDANQVTIQPDSGTINGSASYVFFNQHKNFQFQSDGTNLYVLSSS